MKIFISGGCKNGKSTYAENIAVSLANDGLPLFYVATMMPGDDEDRDRIFRHQQSREGLGFKTIECGKDIIDILKLCHEVGTFLLDSVTALLANEMFDKNGNVNYNAHTKISYEIGSILSTASNIIIVSDYIYSDGEVYDEFTEAYRKGLAHLDRHCALLCDVVIEVSYNSLIFYKGQHLIGETS